MPATWLCVILLFRSKFDKRRLYTGSSQDAPVYASVWINDRKTLQGCVDVRGNYRVDLDKGIGEQRRRVDEGKVDIWNLVSGDYLSEDQASKRSFDACRNRGRCEPSVRSDNRVVEKLGEDLLRDISIDASRITVRHIAHDRENGRDSRVSDGQPFDEGGKDRLAFGDGLGREQENFVSGEEKEPAGLCLGRSSADICSSGRIFFNKGVTISS